MTIYKIPVEWAVFGLLEVEANSIEQAMELVNQDCDLSGNEFALPNESDYIDGSFQISYGYTDEEIMEIFNGGVE